MAQKQGFFEEAGLEVAIDSPSDPAAPLKEVAAGRSDLAISYEPEVTLAHEQGLDVVAVAALVNRPLTSLIWLEKSGIKGVGDLQRQDRRLRRDPLPGSLPEDDPRPRQAPPGDVKDSQRRLRPAAGAGRRLGPGDARRLHQRRGRRPARTRQRAGRHPGRPARRADLRRARPRRQPQEPGRRPGQVSASSSPPCGAAPKRRSKQPERGDRGDPRSQPPTSNRN